MNREIKFRAWDVEAKMMHVAEATYHWDLGDLASGKPCDWVWMQYTGLKDKNGKEIYQGDLLRVAKGIVYKIWWSNSSAGFVGSTPNKWASAANIRKELVQKIRWIVEKEGEIIGNIWENPELLTNPTT